MSPAARLSLAVASSAIAYGAALAVPALAAPLLLLAPLPGMLVGVSGSVGATATWGVLASVVVSLVLGGPVALGFLLPIALPALAVALAVRLRWSFDRAVLAGLVVWCLGVLCLLVKAYGDVDALLAAAREQLGASFDLALATSQSMGAPDSTIAVMEADKANLVSSLLELLPAFVLLTGGVFVVVNVLLLRSWAGVYGHVNLRLWRAPDALIWLLIAAGFAMFVPIPLLSLAARNVFIAVLGCYFCQGLAIVSYYLARFRLPRALRIASFALIAIHQVFAATVLALGIFDFWANFRRPSPGPAEFDFRD
jgi:uncharacterized protein YybS (DUF2232 family)